MTSAWKYATSQFFNLTTATSNRMWRARRERKTQNLSGEHVKVVAENNLNVRIYCLYSRKKKAEWENSFRALKLCEFNDDDKKNQTACQPMCCIWCVCSRHTHFIWIIMTALRCMTVYFCFSHNLRWFTSLIAHCRCISKLETGRMSE